MSSGLLYTLKCNHPGCSSKFDVKKVLTEKTLTRELLQAKSNKIKIHSIIWRRAAPLGWIARYPHGTNQYTLSNPNYYCPAHSRFYPSFALQNREDAKIKWVQLRQAEERRKSFYGR